MKTLVISGRTSGSAGQQRGLVVVELAITLPLIVMIMFATAELGRAFYQYSTLTKAVEAGTRYYASALNDLTIVEANKIPTTKNLVAFASPDGSGASVIPGFNTGNVTVDAVLDDHVRVSAVYDFAPMLGASLPIIGTMASFTMTASHSMRAL